MEEDLDIEDLSDNRRLLTGNGRALIGNMELTVQPNLTIDVERNEGPVLIDNADQTVRPVLTIEKVWNDGTVLIDDADVTNNESPNDGNELLIDDPFLRNFGKFLSDRHLPLIRSSGHGLPMINADTARR